MILLSNGCAEGRKSIACVLEALLAEGDTDKGDAKDYAPNKDANYVAKTVSDKPNGVSNGMSLEVCVNGFAEGECCKTCHLEALKTERNTYDGNAICKAQNQIGD